MKKLLLALLLLATPFIVLADSNVDMYSNKVHINMINKPRPILNPDEPGNLKYLPFGVTYLEDHRDQTLHNAEYSNGTPVSRVTATRSATAPATYFDASGVMQVTTTSNVARDTEGYYDATGWHAAPMMLLEGQSANYAINSYFSLDSNSDGLSDGWGTSWASITATRETCSINGLTDGKSQKVAYTFTGSEADNSGFINQTTANDTFDASGGNITVTLSFWARGDYSGITTGRDANRAVIITEVNNSSTYQRNALVKYVEDLVNDGLSPTEWRRFSYTTTITDTDTRKLTTWLGIWIGTANKPVAGENLWVEIYGVQVEKQAYPSSYIPTTTAALTRGAESLAPSAANNFPAPSGNNCLSFDGANASGDDYVSIANSATGNQFKDATLFSMEAWAFVRSDGEGDNGRIICKVATGGSFELGVNTQSGSNFSVFSNVIFAGGNVGTGNIATTGLLNTWAHFLITVEVDQKIRLYVNGSLIHTSHAGTGAFDDDSGGVLCIGNRATDTARTFDGFIQATRIYRDKALSAAEVATAYAAGRYASQPVTGCTAEYLFNEGTGTTLTDSVAGNNGTISGATWSKDTYSGSVMVKYRPVMLQNEGDFKRLFNVDFSSTTNTMHIIYGTAANNFVYFNTASNGNNLAATPSATALTRYSSYTLIVTWSTTADGSGKKLNIYKDGALLTTQSSFAVPAGALTTSFSIQPSAGQAAGYEVIGIWNRVLSASEIKQATAY